MELFVAAVVGVLALAACSAKSPRRAPAGQSSAATTATTALPAGGAVPSSTLPGVAAAPARPPHVMLIVLENREFGDVVGTRAAPFMNALAARYGLATGVVATTHPSLPNYLALLAGSTFGVTSDCTSCAVDGRTLVDQLDDAHVPWAAFMEGMPSPCFTGASAGRYAKKHNPFVYFRHLVADPATCARVQPAGGLDAALEAPDPPAFIWLTPDLCNDGHDCTTSTMDTWLHQRLTAIQASPWYRDGGIVVVTYDEGNTGASCCGGQARGGRIATFVVSEGGPPGARLGTPVAQVGILATIEDLYRLPRLADAAAPSAGSLDPLLPHG